jgi:hypothetical protein
LARIGMENFDVCQATRSDEMPSAFDLFSVAFDTDDPAGRTDTPREKTETTPWAAANLDDLPTVTNADLVK